MAPITVERCSCGHPGCRDYWLGGVGKFMQGSGFTQHDAERIADLLNGSDVKAAMLKNELIAAVDDIKSAAAIIQAKGLTNTAALLLKHAENGHKVIDAQG